MGEVVWIVKNPELRKYFQFKNTKWQLLRLFDGTRTRTEIVEDYNRIAGKDAVDLSLVLDIEEDLRSMELIQLSSAERSLILLDKFRTLREKRADGKSEGFNIFFIMFQILDPDRFLTRTVKYIRWIWTPPVAVVTCLAAVWTLSVFVRNWGPIWSGTMNLYHFIGKPFPDFLQFFVILCVIGAIHEFSHGYVCKIYGGEVHNIGFALFYFTPAFYCNTSDSFMFPNRFQRLWVTIAGIYIEVIICSLATLLWVASYPDSFLHQVAYKTMLFTGVSTILFNVNPLIKVDGYYAISSLLQLQDLREGAFSLLSARFQKYVFRLPVEIPAMSRRKRRLYTIYGIAAVLYTTFIMFVIGRFFNNIYTKYFPDFATVLLILTLYYIFRKRARKAIRVAKLFYLDKKELLMSPRIRLPVGVVVFGVLVILLVPWTRRTISGDAFLKPAEEVSVQAPEDGIVTDVFVREGEMVARGQPLFRVSSPEVDAEARRSFSERERFTKKSSSSRSYSNATLAFQFESRAGAAQTALETAEYRQGFLLVRSPIAGRVLTPRTQDLGGRYVTAGFTLARIGDCRKVVAQVPVSERFLEYLKPGAPLTARIRTRPFNSWSGSILTISPATLEQPTTSAAGRDPVAPSARPDHFVALAVFENPDGSLLPGAAARIKIHANREAYASRIWSVLWRWLRTIIW